jgi:hypothetical protein
VGLAGAAKILPLVVLLPVLAADPDAWRAGQGPRRGVVRVCLGLAVGFGGGFVAPMILLSPRGLQDLVGYHAARGLQIESTYAAVLSLLAVATGHPVSATLSYGSYNLDTPAADVMARLASPLVVVALLALTVWLARLPAPEGDGERVERIACAGLAALLCVWLGGKLFSPQYMTWAIPLALVVGPPRRRAIAASLLVAMVIAQVYLRGFYDYVADMRPLGVAALLARLGALVAMAFLLVRALCRSRAPSDGLQ